MVGVGGCNHLKQVKHAIVPDVCFLGNIFIKKTPNTCQTQNTKITCPTAQDSTPLCRRHSMNWDSCACHLMKALV